MFTPLEGLYLSSGVNFIMIAGFTLSGEGSQGEIPSIILDMPRRLDYSASCEIGARNHSDEPSARRGESGWQGGGICHET